MVIAVLADEQLKNEFLSKPVNGSEIIWADSIRSLLIIEADVYFDLKFEMDQERISKLKTLLPKMVIVNSVVHTVRDMRASFVRINAWPTMLQNEITELCCATPALEEKLSAIFEAIGWKYLVVPDVPGMIRPRIISMIINEAWWAYAESISSKEEIDTAMKLGTNYPYGPFEWAEKIGMQNIVSLLKELSHTDTRYTIAPALSDLNKKDALHFKY